MPYKQCPSCGGSGYNARSGVMPGTLKNAPRCSGCNGSGRKNMPDPPSYGGGANQNGCFPASVQVLTPSGHRRISEFCSGDTVTGVDVESGQLSSRRVLRVKRYLKREIWRLAFDESTIVETTAFHSFNTRQGWEIAKNIKAGDEVLRCKPSGQVSHCRVDASFGAAETEDVYNLVVEGDFTFVANGAVASCFTAFRRSRKMYWTLLHRILAHGVTPSLEPQTIKA